MKIGNSLALAALVGLVAAGQSTAEDWNQEYAQRSHTAQLVSPLSDTTFGDNISLFNGTVNFTATDISLPGNNGLAVELRRTLDLQDLAGDQAFGQGVINWDIDLPYLSGVFVAAGAYQSGTAPGYWEPNIRCTTTNLPPMYQVNWAVTFRAGDYWSGNRLHLPDGDSDLLAMTSDPKLVMPNKTGLSPWITKNHWTFGCTPSLQSGESGEGFIGYAPDGRKITFDWMDNRFYTNIAQSVSGGNGQNSAAIDRVQSRIYPTRIEDRFGNWVTYTWTHVTVSYGTLSRLTRILASDGREIDLSYDPTTAQLVSATAAGRTWNYGNDGGQVTNPDGSTWTYSGAISKSIRYLWGWYRASPDPANPWNAVDPSDPMAPSDPLYPSDPSNPVVPVYYAPVILNAATCWPEHVIDTTASTYTSTLTITHPSGATATYTFQPMRHGFSNVPNDCAGLDMAQVNSIPLTHDVETLISKTVTGPGLTPATTTYSYAGLDPGYDYTITPTIFGEDTTAPPHLKIVTINEPDGTQIVNSFGKDYGLNEGQLLDVEIKKDGVTYRTTANTYISDAEAAAAAFPASMGDSEVKHADTFSSSELRPLKATAIAQDGASFNSLTNLFDAFARGTSETRSSSLGATRTDTTGYYDDLAQWVLGQTHTTTNTNTGLVTAQTDYDAATDLPIRTYAFGVLQQTLGYAADGTLNTVMDGLGHTTTLSNWHRGIPQSIQNADTTTKTAVVNDSGWVTSVTDENGFATNYTYDLMGRMASITYPTGDTPAWTPTTQVFEQVASTEVGIPAGHWRQTVSTGNARKVTYLDAFWRPVVSSEYDNVNAAATTRYTRNAYDVMGRTVFASYPGTTDALTNGTHTTYDALGRPLTSVQDSELGALTTTMQYLTGFQTKVTNPRGYATTTSYQVFDSPDTSHPTLIVAPEGVTTTITRDVFGKPLTVSRTTSGG